MRTGIVYLPLHYGEAPSWLFNKMRKLAQQIIFVMVKEVGAEEVVRRFSDPFWFQAFGCVLGFDWHSSGLTTTVCAAVKEGIRGMENELGLFVAGGKGSTARKTPQEIIKFGEQLAVEPEDLVYVSKMTAKVDNSALQDGFRLYHHCIFFSKTGSWSVVQQGMDTISRYARRYHWWSKGVQRVKDFDFVCEPHQAICCDKKNKNVLNLVAKESDRARETITQLSAQNPEKTLAEFKKIQTITLPMRHSVDIGDINPNRLYKILLQTYSQNPKTFEQLLGINGVGPNTIRALSLISELIYGVAPSFQDPARYSFAHGGKDGHPYPIDLKTYNQTIEILHKAISSAKLGLSEKLEAIRRLEKI